MKFENKMFNCSNILNFMKNQFKTHLIKMNKKNDK